MKDDNVWIPTEEVTAEQVFKWGSDDWAKAQKKALEAKAAKVFYLPFRRVYVGRTKTDGSDVERCIWTHGYKMVYWGVSREVVSLCKKKS
jgi:hypothetical protein